MTIVLVLMVLILAQILTGAALLKAFRRRLNTLEALVVAITLGTGVFSLIPFVLELLHVRINAFTVFIPITVFSAAGLAAIPWATLKKTFQTWKAKAAVYSIPQILVIAFLMVISIWRCYYLPPTPRDLNSGAEVIAEYAVKEHSLVNSVFTLDLSTTNNQFKPPFISSLQVIYKLAGLPFGQVWLALLSVALTIFVFAQLSKHLHTIIAGFLLVAYIAIPELYAYSFMALYDYPNVVFLTFSLFYVSEFLEDEKTSSIVLAGVLFLFATYVRSETLIIGGFLFLPVFWFHVHKRDSIIRIIRSGLCFLLPAVVIYFVSVKLYINYYLPSHYKIEALVNSNLFDPTPLLKRFGDMNNELIFSESGVEFYGYFIILYLTITIFDTVVPLPWPKGSAYWFAVTVIIYLAIPFLGYLFPLMDLYNTTKRGLFKLFPLMLMSLAMSPSLRYFSERLRAWERS